MANSKAKLVGNLTFTKEEENKNKLFYKYRFSKCQLQIRIGIKVTETLNEMRSELYLYHLINHPCIYIYENSDVLSNIAI